ncbi:GNAT family N-acetyltransferase [Novosphingobium colocasiae]
MAPLVSADHFRSESYLAFDAGNGQLVGSALLACDKAMDTGEIAVSVRRDYKGRGVGWALLDFLGSKAQARDLRRVIAIESRQKSRRHRAGTRKRASRLNLSRATRPSWSFPGHSGKS